MAETRSKRNDFESRELLVSGQHTVVPVNLRLGSHPSHLERLPECLPGPAIYKWLHFEGDLSKGIVELSNSVATVKTTLVVCKMCGLTGS